MTPVLGIIKLAVAISFSRLQNTFQRVYPRGGGFFPIVKAPGDLPPARVYFFKPSSLAKGILFANFVHLVWARVSFLAILVDFSLGKGMLFGNFGQRNVKLR